MPWVLEETFAAGGLDLHSEVTLRRLDPLYRIRWAARGRAPRLLRRPGAAARRGGEVLRARRGAGRAVPRGAAPDLRARHPRRGAAAVHLARSTSRGSCPTMVRLDALRPLHSFVARCFEHPRVREAFSFHSLFIGGDPYRVPAIYGALVYLQVPTAAGTPTAAIYAVVEAMARAARRALRRAGRGDRARRRPRDRRAARGRRADRGRRRRLERRRAAHARAGRAPPRRGGGCARRCRASCSTSARTGRSSALLHHTLLVGDGYREFIRAVTRGRELPRTFSTYVHAPARTEPAMAPPGGDSLAVLLPVPNLRAGDRLGPRRRPAARRAARRPGDELRAGRARATRSSSSTG